MGNMCSKLPHVETLLDNYSFKVFVHFWGEKGKF